MMGFIVDFKVSTVGNFNEGHVEKEDSNGAEK